MRDEDRDVRETTNGRAEAHAAAETGEKRPIPDPVTILLAAVVSALVALLLR